MAESEKSPLQLKDVLPNNYDATDYFSQDEIQWIQMVLGTPLAIKILRKIFLPTVHDPELPIEEFAKDIFGKDLNYLSMDANNVKAIVQGRQEAVKFIMDGLIRIKVIASFKEQKGGKQKAIDSAK